MQSFVITVLGLVAAIQAVPYVGTGYVGGPGGYGGGYGGGGYGSGSEYGNAGYQGGQNGYTNQGYGSQGLQEGHDIHHLENDFDSTVHHHQLEDHNAGGISQGSQGGQLNSGYGGYQGGQNNYGHGYGQGYNNYGI